MESAQPGRVQAKGVGMTEGAAEKSGEGGRWGEGAPASRVGRSARPRAGLRPCCPHLLVDVDGLLVLLQLRRVAGHLQETLVGRAERGREGQGVSGGGALGPRRGRGQAGGAWVPVGLLAFVVVCGLLVVGDGLGHTGRGRGRGAQAAFVAGGPSSSATPQAPRLVPEDWPQQPSPPLARLGPPPPTFSMSTSSVS